ncbi:WD40 repeat domain-containing protein [Streptomyces sp. NPDC059063]|uniref:WD40 repeat domain-containing protein n=1 Tax=unclassified Streptomyces TaxID=2593676 RepID=UPI00368BA3C8
MNVEQLVRDALQEEAAEGGPARADLADRVLAARRRRTVGALAGGAVATAAAVALALVVVPGDAGQETATPASESLTSDVIGHPDQSPPRDLIAAGNTAMSGYFTIRTEKQSNGDEVLKRRYTLLDQKTGKYEKADAKWAWVDVAPGMRTAAVLEGELPARRIGLLDLMTGEVERWITVQKPVAGVEWSPDGKRLVATAYSKDPDRFLAPPKNYPKGPTLHHGSRTGFYIIDAGSGEVGPFRDLRQPQPKKGHYFQGNSREDLDWSPDGTKIYTDGDAEGGTEVTYARERGITDGKAVPDGDVRDTEDASEPAGQSRYWYTLDGKKTKTPAEWQFAGWPQAGLSPDGVHIAADEDSEGSVILDPKTGRVIARVPGMEQLAWADNKRLIAWGCATKCKSEFGSQLILVSLNSDKVVPLSGHLKPSADSPRRWTPLLTAR